MNCRRVEKLIPLYVEGDLASRSTDQVASHLEWCGRCNWLADEYRESQNWLRSSDAPEFDQAFLTDFKRDVLKGVSNTRPSFLASFLGSSLADWTQHWNRRQVLALGAALMIIFGVLALYLYQTSLRHGSAVHEIAEQTQSDEKNNPSSPDMSAGTKQAPGATSTGERRSNVRSIAAQRTARRSLLSATNKVAEPQNPDRQMSSAPTFDSREVLRIEIQTSDPNIRIIWFAPKEADSNQNKPATD